MTGERNNGLPLAFINQKSALCRGNLKGNFYSTTHRQTPFMSQDASSAHGDNDELDPKIIVSLLFLLSDMVVIPGSVFNLATSTLFLYPFFCTETKLFFYLCSQSYFTLPSHRCWYLNGRVSEIQGSVFYITGLLLLLKSLIHSASVHAPPVFSPKLRSGSWFAQLSSLHNKKLVTLSSCNRL